MEDNSVAMRGLLAGKVAVITGAAAGIGAATAHLFGEEGAHVFVLDLNGSRAAAVAEYIRTRGGSGFSFLADVRKPEAVQASIGQTGCVRHYRLYTTERTSRD